ncbi:MAG TPA: Rid family detoxifying hydrolase [Candidatus Bathyarchaeia archaeon]
MKKIVQSENAPKPVGPYSQAVVAGSFLFVSGQIAIDSKEGKIVASDIKTQTRQVLDNIKSILQAADCDLKDVVQANVYLSSLALFSEFNNIYSSYFLKAYPARTTVEAKLPLGALVEISVVVLRQ